MTTLPTHDPYLRRSTAAFWYDMPGGPRPCAVCGYEQTWALPVDRYLSTPPRLVGPVLRDVLDVPDSEDPPPPPAPAAWHPPPGWGHVFCRLCGAHLVLVLRQMPAIGLLNPPALLEISTVRLNFSTVQYRLPDQPSSGAERWRTALVTRQHDRRTLDLQVTLIPDDPEYHQQLLAGLRMVEVRLEDHDGAERWRAAVIAGRSGDAGALNLTAHYDPSDPEAAARGWVRLNDAIRGDAVGQWRYPSQNLTAHLQVARAETGQRHGQWLPINNT